MNEAESLPPLPEPAVMCDCGGDYYTADQIRAAVLAERDRLAAKWEAYHGFDKYGVAGFIRETK